MVGNEKLGEISKDTIDVTLVKQPLAQSVSLQLLSISGISQFMPIFDSESVCGITISELVPSICIQLHVMSIASADGTKALNTKMRTKTRRIIKLVYLHLKETVKIVEIYVKFIEFGCNLITLNYEL